MPRIHLAEDDQTMVTLLTTLLGIEGFEVVNLDLSGGNLLSVLQENAPEVLLIDVNLPGQNGLDVVRSMRQDPFFAKTRIVMASGMSVEKECLESGADAFLLKPYMPDELIEVLRKFI